MTIRANYGILNNFEMYLGTFPTLDFIEVMANGTWSLLGSTEFERQQITPPAITFSKNDFKFGNKNVVIIPLNTTKNSSISYADDAVQNLDPQVLTVNK